MAKGQTLWRSSGSECRIAAAPGRALKDPAHSQLNIGCRFGHHIEIMELYRPDVWLVRLCVQTSFNAGLQREALWSPGTVNQMWRKGHKMVRFGGR